MAAFPSASTSSGRTASHSWKPAHLVRRHGAICARPIRSGRFPCLPKAVDRPRGDHVRAAVYEMVLAHPVRFVREPERERRPSRPRRRASPPRYPLTLRETVLGEEAASFYQFRWSPVSRRRAGRRPESVRSAPKGKTKALLWLAQGSRTVMGFWWSSLEGGWGRVRSGGVGSSGRQVGEDF